jgi:hypothetical protein
LVQLPLFSALEMCVPTAWHLSLISRTQTEFDEIISQNNQLHASTAPVESVLNAFTCPECMAGFATQQDLMVHFSAKHG